MRCHQVVFYITVAHHIPRSREGKKYIEGPTQSTMPLNGRETEEGWDMSCHWCHGSASQRLVHDLTSLAVRPAFSAVPSLRCKDNTGKIRVMIQTDAQYSHPPTNFYPSEPGLISFAMVWNCKQFVDKWPNIITLKSHWDHLQCCCN